VQAVWNVPRPAGRCPWRIPGPAPDPFPAYLGRGLPALYQQAETEAIVTADVMAPDQTGPPPDEPPAGYGEPRTGKIGSMMPRKSRQIGYTVLGVGLAVTAFFIAWRLHGSRSSGATGLSFLLCAKLNITLMEAVAANGSGQPPFWADLLVTGLVVGAGTKPLHDLVTNIERKQDSPRAAGRGR
jgi:hypothetical protein